MFSSHFFKSFFVHMFYSLSNIFITNFYWLVVAALTYILQYIWNFVINFNYFNILWIHEHFNSIIIWRRYFILCHHFFTVGSLVHSLTKYCIIVQSCLFFSDFKDFCLELKVVVLWFIAELINLVHVLKLLKCLWQSEWEKYFHNQGHWHSGWIFLHSM